jgi:diketogulonate reductase-like aldo/keto reductase
MTHIDTDDMAELSQVPSGDTCTTNQVLYNLTRRGVEWDLLPWCYEHGVPVMAYSPIEQARMLGHPALMKLAKQRGITPAQLALAWLLHQEGVVVIPKAGTPEHVRENAAALEVTLDAETLGALDAAFPPPKGKRGLEML